MVTFSGTPPMLHESNFPPWHSNPSTSGPYLPLPPPAPMPPVSLPAASLLSSTWWTPTQPSRPDSNVTCSGSLPQLLQATRSSFLCALTSLRAFPCNSSYYAIIVFIHIICGAERVITAQFGKCGQIRE